MHVLAIDYHPDDNDFADFVRTCSKFRGLKCGADYVEAFT